MKSLLEQVYSLVPELECKGKCQESCGPIDLSDKEREIIKEFCIKNNIPYHHIDKITPLKLYQDMHKTDEELMCPYLKDGKCSIYEARPLICRLWGNIDSMPCLWGCKPKTRMLTAKEGHKLLERLEV